MDRAAEGATEAQGAGVIEWATMAEVARLFGWSESYARKLAHRDGWRRVGYAPRLYAINDAGRVAARFTLLPPPR